jgi:hypothetical protein
MPINLDNQRELVERARACDHEEFTRLVRQGDRHIYRLALNITEDPLEEADISAR